MTELRRADFGTPFTWGVAHAAYQVEGAWDRDGKGPSIWDTFTDGGRRIRDGSSGKVACEFYDRYPADTALVADLGFDAQRFSVSWPRVLPQGTGRVNAAGLDFYDRLVDACLGEGVEPWCTLYHWDLPQALQDRGGWANRSIVGWFQEYVSLVASRLGDRVRNWMIFNEPASFVLGGHFTGVHAPGGRGLRRTLAATHHVNLCQSVGAEAVRAVCPEARVGTTHIVVPVRAAGDTARHRRAVGFVDAFVNRMFVEPNLGLGYPTDANRWIGGVDRYRLPGDDETIRVRWDFVGVQYYTRLLVRPTPIPGLPGVPQTSRDHRRFEITAMGWEVQPDGLCEALRKVSAYDPVLPLVVTENGAAFPDRLEGDRVHDERRVAFYRSHLAEVRRAQDQGVPVHGYFCWSLLDNFEWAEGYVPRFGITYVDYPTQRRVVKDSGLWFQDLLAG